jgi:antitoxin component of MazEF toxin-antitoxin module
MAKLVKMGGSGSLGITLPKDKLDEHGLEAGDEVGIVTTDDPDILQIHLPPKQEE